MAIRSGLPASHGEQCPIALCHFEGSCTEYGVFATQLRTVVVVSFLAVRLASRKCTTYYVLYPQPDLASQILNLPH